MTCTSCGEQSGSRLPVYSEVGTAAGERGGVVRGLGIPAATDALFPHIRIEACETCRRYLLNIDVAADAQVDALSVLALEALDHLQLSERPDLVVDHLQDPQRVSRPVDGGPKKREDNEQ